MQHSNLIIAIIIAIPFLLLTFIATRFSVRFLWVVLFAYPQGLTAGLLPLNIGVDDLYIIVLGVAVLLKRMFSGRVIFGFATIGTFLFWIIESTSNMTGALTGPAYLMEGAIKDTLKGITYIIFGFIMDNSLDDRTDIESTLKWMIFGGLCGTITAIGQALFEPYFRIFTVWRPEVWQVQYVHGGGAFLSPFGAGLMTMVFLIFSVSRLRMGRVLASKTVNLAMGLVFLTGLVLSQTRLAWVGVISLALFWAVFSPFRRYVFLIGVIAVIGIFSTEYTMTVIGMRLATIVPAAQNRIEIWLTIVKNASLPYIFLCGRGAAAEFAKLEATPHSTYIHILFELGVLGAAWAIWFIVRLLRTASFLRKYGDAQAQFAGNWVLYSLMGLAVAGIAGEVLFVSFVRYTLFLMAALVYRWKMIIENELTMIPAEGDVYEGMSEEKDLIGLTYEEYR